MSSSDEHAGHFRPPTCAACGAELPRGSKIGEPCPSCSSTTGPAAVVELELVDYRRPTLEVTDFEHRLEPHLDEATGELVGAVLTLAHPLWPASLRLHVSRLWLVEFATGALALVDSHEQTGGGE